MYSRAIRRRPLPVGGCDFDERHAGWPDRVKERRRTEILNAAEAIAKARTWDALTMKHVALRARRSRALIYVYFKNKTALLSGIRERGFATLAHRFTEAVSRETTGIDQLIAIGRAYVAFSQEFPARFEAIARNALRSERSEALTTSNQQACHDILARAVERGVSDSSIRSDVGDSRIVSSVFLAFIHGALRSSMAKTSLPARTHIIGVQVIEQALSMARRAMQGETA